MRTRSQVRITSLILNFTNGLLVFILGATQPSFFYGKRRVAMVALVLGGTLVFTASLQFGLYPGTVSAALPLVGFDSKTVLVRQLFDLILFHIRGFYTVLVHPKAFVMLRARMELKAMDKSTVLGGKRVRSRMLKLEKKPIRTMTYSEEGSSTSTATSSPRPRARSSSL